MVRVIREGDTWELISQPPRSALLLTSTMSSKTDDNENDPQNPDTAQTLFLPHDPCFSPYLCNPPATPLRSLPPQLFDTFNCLIPPLQPYRHPASNKYSLNAEFQHNVGSKYLQAAGGLRELFAADTGSGSRHFLFCQALYPSFCVSKLYLRL